MGIGSTIPSFGVDSILHLLPLEKSQICPYLVAQISSPVLDLIMGQYQVNSSNSRNFDLTKDNIHLGELSYPKWYTFNAEIILADLSRYQLVPQGRWDATIQLKQDHKTLMDFKMGWKGIILSNITDGNRDEYLLTLKSLLSSKYVLMDANGKELLGIELELKWNQSHFDYHILTVDEFDNFYHPELFLLTTIHAVNYYLTVVIGS